MKPEEKTKRFYEIVTNLANMYAKKNTDYGDSFGKLYDDLGPTAGLVPLYNKLHRITSVIKNNNSNFESLEDSFKDLACYAIMNLIEIEEENKQSSSENCVDIKHLVTTDDPCAGCKVKEMLRAGVNFADNLPCGWCNNNSYKLNDITLTMKGSNLNE